MSTPKINTRQLLAYAANELSSEEAQVIEAHLANSPAAAKTVAVYRRVSNIVRTDDTVAPSESVLAKVRSIYRAEHFAKASSSVGSWLDRAADTIARMVFDSRVELAGVRYSDQGCRFQLSYETQVSEIDLDFEAIPDTETTGMPPRWRLMGQAGGEEDLARIRVAAVQAGSSAIVAEVTSDENAVFTMELTPGRYDLLFDLPEGAVVISEVELT